jgi:predicted lipid-binding transport protein (Tim44 family)
MRAGLIIGGLFLMFVGLILFFSLWFTLVGLVSGLIGFIMLIMGLFTSSYHPPPQVTTTVYAPPPPLQQQYAQAQPVPKQGEVKYCQACGTPTSKDLMYCGKCGKKFSE